MRMWESERRDGGEGGKEEEERMVMVMVMKLHAGLENQGHLRVPDLSQERMCCPCLMET